MEDQRSLDNLVLEMKGVYVALPALQPAPADDWSAAPAAAADGGAAAELRAHAHGLARQIEALRVGPPRPLLRREDALLVLEALVSGETLAGLEALERATGASPAEVYCGFVDTAHRIIYDAVAEDRLSAAAKMASCLSGVDDVAAYFRDMLRNTSRPLIRERLLQILYAADGGGAAGAAHGYGELLELRTLALEVELAPPERSMRLLAPSVRLGLALDHFYSVESFGVEFNSRSTALIMRQLVEQPAAEEAATAAAAAAASVPPLQSAGLEGPTGWRLGLVNEPPEASMLWHALEDRTGELDDIGPVDWAAVAPNNMRSDIASGVSVSESRHPNATKIDRHAPSERSRQMFDPESFAAAAAQSQAGGGEAAELRAYGHFRLLWLEEWSQTTQVRVLAEVCQLLPARGQGAGVTDDDPWLAALRGSDVETEAGGRQEGELLQRKAAELQYLIDRHDVDGAVSWVRSVIRDGYSKVAMVELVEGAVAGCSGYDQEQAQVEAHCSVLMCEALLNELAAAALFLPAEREPALMVRRLARSGLLFESPRQSEPEPEPEPEPEQQPGEIVTGAGDSDTAESAGAAEAAAVAAAAAAAAAAATTESLVLRFLTERCAYAAISAFLRCRYPRAIAAAEVAACLEAVGTSDPWACFIVGSLSEHPEDTFRACCQNGAALLDSSHSGSATVQAMLEAGEPLMALGTLLFAPAPLQSITDETADPAYRLDLQLLRQALEGYSIDIERLFSSLSSDDVSSSKKNEDGHAKLWSCPAAGLAKAASDAMARQSSSSNSNSNSQQATTTTTRADAEADAEAEPEPKPSVETDAGANVESTQSPMVVNVQKKTEFVQTFGAPASDLGFADELDSVYYLEQCRPAAAAEWHCRRYNCGTPLDAQSNDEDSGAAAVVATARSVALRNTAKALGQEDNARVGVVSACVQFCHLFGLDSQVLRADAAAIDAIRSYLSRSRESSDDTAAGPSSPSSPRSQSNMESACRTTGPQITINVQLVQECLEQVATAEAVAVAAASQANTVSKVASGGSESGTRETAWDVLRTFCDAHGLPMSLARARWLASSGQWVELLCEAQLSSLSIADMLEVVSSNCKPGIREHLILFLRSQAKADGDYDDMSAAEIHRQQALDNAGHVYDELCGTLLECIRRANPAKAMLEAAIETHRPILALISHSGFSGSTTESMLAFLCARLPPEQLDPQYQRFFCSEQAVAESDAVDLLQAALCETVRLRRAAVAAEALVAFCPEHPLHSLFSFVRNCMQRRYQHAQDDLTDFISKSSLGGNIAWTQSGLGAPSTCKIARAVVECLYQSSGGVEKIRLAQVAGSAGQGFSPVFFRRGLIVNLLQHSPPVAAAESAEQQGCSVAAAVDLSPKEAVQLLVRRRCYAQAHAYVGELALYAARQRLAFGAGIRSLLGQHQYPTTIWPRLRDARITLVASAMSLAAEALVCDIVPDYDVVLAQAGQAAADFRAFGIAAEVAASDSVQQKHRPPPPPPHHHHDHHPSTAGTGLWDRCHGLLVDGSVPPRLMAEFFLSESEKPTADRAERMELLSWVRTVLDSATPTAMAQDTIDTDWKDTVMRRVFGVMDMDEEDEEDEEDDDGGAQGGGGGGGGGGNANGNSGGNSGSPALVMVRRHNMTDSASLAEALAVKVAWSHGDGEEGNSRRSSSKAMAAPGDSRSGISRYSWQEWEEDILELEEPTAVAEALLSRVEAQPLNVANAAAAANASSTVGVAIERDTLLVAHQCAVAGSEVQCIHRVLDVLQARAKVYLRFGHRGLLEEALLLLAGCDEHHANVQPLLDIYLYHEDRALLPSIIDLATTPYADDDDDPPAAAEESAAAAATGRRQRQWRQQRQRQWRQQQRRSLQAALLRCMKQRPSQFGSEIGDLHRRLLPARRREYATFLQERSDGKMHELVRARRLHSADAELQAEMSRTAIAAQRLYGEAARYYAEEGCYREQQRCSCLASLLEYQQQHPDLELLELDRGPAAAAQALRHNGGLRSLGDVATYQLLATAHGFERQLDEAWPDLVYEHAILNGSLEFFAQFLRRVRTERLAVFYEALARRHYLAAATERRSADEKSFEDFMHSLKQAGMLDAHRKMHAAAEDTRRLLRQHA